MAKAKKKSKPKKTVWTDEEKLFGAKSKIVNLDLSRFFSAPEAWSTLEEAEKIQLRALLPPHVELDDDGSIPQSFLKYDPDWRNALHQFQTDLAAGRYDPIWLEEAAQAMEARAAGAFDSFKETEFEEFWGQKQRLKPHLSGETATVKLGDLINAGLFRVHDVWSYKRTFGRLLNERIQVEKDCVVTAIEGGTLTFLIPPGERKFLTTDCFSEDSVIVPIHGESTKINEHLPKTVKYSSEPQDSEKARELVVQCSLKRKSEDNMHASTSVSQSRESQVLQAPSVSSKRIKKEHKPILPPPLPPSGTEEIPLVGMATNVLDPANLGDGKCTKEKHDRESSAEPSHARSSPLSTAPSSPLLPVGVQPSPSPSRNLPSNRASNRNVQHQSSLASMLTITTPGALETRIIHIDGRMQNPPAVNSWRSFRVKRMEQDIGSLWEIREEFWVRGKADCKI